MASHLSPEIVALDNGIFIGDIQSMVGGRQVISFDTSAINRLADDPNSDALIAGLRAGYFVRFPFTAVSEIIATSLGVRREQLLRVCRLLLRAGDCIEPHPEILKMMVTRFEDSLPLGHATVNLRMIEAENELVRAGNFDDKLAAEARNDNRLNDRQFRRVYDDAKEPFDKIRYAR